MSGPGAQVEKTIEQKLADAEAAFAKSEEVRRSLELDNAKFQFLLKRRDAYILQLEFDSLQVTPNPPAAPGAPNQG